MYLRQSFRLLHAFPTLKASWIHDSTHQTARLGGGSGTFILYLSQSRRFFNNQYKQAHKMAKKALILIADGTEEMEFTITYDTLVRAGVECTSANVQSGGSPYGSVGTSPALVVCSRGVKILPDTTLQPLSAGPGAETLSQSTEVQTLVREYYESNKIVAMICAGTLAAKTAGLPSQPVTSHPVVKNDLASTYDYKEDSVVVSDEVPGKGTLVTRCAHSTVFPFAFKLVELLCGKAKSDEVRVPMMFPRGIDY
ncbi:class I glutamine amidotransferase-like protein [Boletus reticuloceps]|uniref:D-lactate dehydratase n=1 Tax=Boletus reticuloceps TaxID=495285 RepID=A0A8I3ABZ1_9AGAM|nr:class I glutamine amidotransferase-like protein [Boletus reticuloceps]